MAKLLLSGLSYKARLIHRCKMSEMLEFKRSILGTIIFVLLVLPHLVR